MPPVNCWLIRHGESASNAGLPAKGNSDVPLTEKGEAQFREIAAQLPQRPDMLIVSPFLRSRASAAYIEERWPDLRLEIWPIQELTYLSPARCLNTTNQTRQPLVATYWQHCDPDYVDGADAESFTAFMARLRDFHARLLALDVGFTVAVGHGQFFVAYQHALKQGFSASPAWMKFYRATETTTPLPNGGIIRLSAKQLAAARAR